MRSLDLDINDRGSKYAVSGGPVQSRADIQALIATLKREKRFQRATHHSWGAVLTDGGPLKGDDGEAGAGAIILQHLTALGLCDHVVIVTRWYGGKHLGGDRFRHIAEAARTYLSTLP